MGEVSLGPDFPVRIMAAVNLSPESFYKGSVAKNARETASIAMKAVDAGADIVDIGAMSTAPYLRNEVSEEVESTRVAEALRATAGIGVTISVDTVRASVAALALDRGALVINDVSGLKNDPKMADVIKERGASVIAMARSTEPSRLGPIPRVRQALGETMRIARKAGIDDRLVVLDPGIGFFREEGNGKAYSRQDVVPWYQWDCEVLANLRQLESLHRPLCVGLSRKSFLGKILKLESPDDRLWGSLAATAIAVNNGARVIRTHDVKETGHAVRVSEAIMKRRGRNRTS